MIITQSINQAIRERNTSICLAFGMLLGNLVLGLCLYSKNQRVQIDIPPSLKTGFWVEGDMVSPSYQKEMALFLSHLMFDKNAMSQRFNHEAFLHYVSPNYQAKMAQRLLADEERYRQEGLSTVFYPKTSVVNSSKNIVKITGDLVATVGSKQVAKDKMSLEIAFSYLYGKWKVVKFIGVKDVK
jgi:type IV conjugative transfer system protein TraE